MKTRRYLTTALLVILGCVVLAVLAFLFLNALWTAVFEVKVDETLAPTSTEVPTQDTPTLEIPKPSPVYTSTVTQVPSLTSTLWIPSPTFTPEEDEEEQSPTKTPKPTRTLTNVPTPTETLTPTQDASPSATETATVTPPSTGEITSTPTPNLGPTRHEANVNCLGAYFNLGPFDWGRFAFIVGTGNLSLECPKCTFEDWKKKGEVAYEEDNKDDHYIQWGSSWIGMRIDPLPLDWAFFIWEYSRSGRPRLEYPWDFPMDCTHPTATPTSEPTWTSTPKVFPSPTPSVTPTPSETPAPSVTQTESETPTLEPSPSSTEEETTEEP